MNKNAVCSSETDLFFSMDSFFLAEMFKYLYLLFAEEDDLPFDVEDYVFTTEAHLLPLSLSIAPRSHLPSAGNATVLHAPVYCTLQNLTVLKTLIIK